MAAKAIVAERTSIALERIREHSAAISPSLGVDATALSETVKGDAAYQQMVRAEQMAELLAAVREKVAPESRKPEPPAAPVSAQSAPAPATADLEHVRRGPGRPRTHK